MSTQNSQDGYRSSNLNEVITYKTDWPCYSFAFSDTLGTFVIGSLLESYSNYIQLLTLSNDSNIIQPISTFDHSYPVTKLIWSPSRAQGSLFASSSDLLRIWKVENNQIMLKASLIPHSENKEYSGPLTSFDWCARDPSSLGTSSVDKTCTIWDLNKISIKKQILAHNSEVNDIAFSQDSNVFVSAGNDYSVRKFDLRSLEQCSIIYENQKQTGVARVSWNKADPNYLAILNMDSSLVVVIDIRNQLFPINELKGHQGGINSMCWSPSSYRICTAGEDGQVIIRETNKVFSGQKDTPLVYSAIDKVFGVHWSDSNEIGMILADSMQYIRV